MMFISTGHARKDAPALLRLVETRDRTDAGTLLRVVVGALPLLISACAGMDASDESVGIVTDATICGSTTDWQDVELYDGSNSTFSPAYVAKYQGAHGKHCSGTLIGRDIFLSVTHSGCTPEQGESVFFNCQLDVNDPTPPDPDAAAAARCVTHSVAEVLLEDTGNDISVARLNGDPGRTFGWVLPSVRLPNVGQGEEVAIFQHPIGAGRRKVVAFGPVVGVTNGDLQYQVDTTGGSSGAGVMDRFGRLVGVHRSSGCTESGGYNNGNRMDRVVNNSQIVRGIAASIWLSTLH